MNIKEILETTTQGISFPTPIGEVCLSVEKCRMNLLMQKYKAVVDSAREKFLSQCTAEPQNEEDLAKIQSIFADCKEDIYREMKKDIASIGAYNISDKNIDGLTVNMCWRFEAIMAALYDLLGEQRYSCSYRELSETQVKTFRSVVGISVEDYISNLGILAALRNSFRDFEFRLVMGLLVCVNHARHPEEDIDDTYDDILESAFGGSEEIEKCSQLLSNIRQNIIPEEQVEKILLYIAQTNPFSMELYTCIVQRCGDKAGEVQALADYLDFGDDVTAYKEEMIQSYFEELPMKTEEEALAAKEKLEAYCASLGYDGEEKEELFEEIRDRLEELDRIYRTVDGIVCETRESADFAREELPQIQEFMAHISAPASDSLLDYEWEVNDKLREFDIKFSSELKAKYVKVMEKYLKDFDDLFCTVGLFKKLDRKAAGKERLLKLIKRCDVSAPDMIAEAYRQMEELLPRVGLERGENEETLNYLEKCKDDLALKFVKENQGSTEEDAKEAKAKLISYCEEIGLTADENRMCIKYIDRVLADFDLKYRTVDQVVCETREGADLARSELEGIRGFMRQISEPTSDSLLDYESGLLEKKKEFEEAFQSELKQKYLNQIEKYLADFDRKFCSVGLFKKVDRKQAGRDRALKYVKKLDCSSPDKVAEAYRMLEEFLPKVGITLEEAVEAVQYLEKKKSGKGLFGSVGKLFGK